MSWAKMRERDKDGAIKQVHTFDVAPHADTWGMIENATGRVEEYSPKPINITVTTETTDPNRFQAYLDLVDAVTLYEIMLPNGEKAPGVYRVTEAVNRDGQWCVSLERVYRESEDEAA